jgi:predicted MFS family arabinose efflux permease
MVNRNVRTVFLYSFTYYLAGSIFAGDLLSVFIYKLTESSEDVGAISGSRGIATVIFAFPVAYFADRFRRDRILKFSSLVGFLSLACTVYVFTQLQPGTKNLTILYSCFIGWGLFTVLANPNLESIFADSIETGRRRQIMSQKSATISFAASFGPLLTIIYYWIQGERFKGTWKINQLRLVLLGGAGICAISLVLLWSFNDDDSLGKESESDANDKFTEKKESNLSSLIDESILSNENSSSNYNDENLPCCFVPRNVVPYVIAFGDFFTAVGAGMTVKYFPLFFVNMYSLSPISLSILYFVTRISTALAALALDKLAGCIDSRVAVLLGAKTIGTACLYMLAFFDPRFKEVYLVALIYILRTAIMNGTTGIKRSLLMDCVPKKSRAAWNSFESITRFTWSGSAVLGGYLVEQYSFKFCFLVTAIIYTMSTGVFYALLAADIPKEKKMTNYSSDNCNNNNQQIQTNSIDDNGFHEHKSHRSMNTKPTTSYRTLN